MNARAAVLLQEFGIVQLLAAGTPVGARPGASGLREAGVTDAAYAARDRVDNTTGRSSRMGYRSAPASCA